MSCSTLVVPASGLLVALALSGCAVEDAALPEDSVSAEPAAPEQDARRFALAPSADGFRAIVDGGTPLSLTASNPRTAATVRVRYRWLTAHDHGTGVVDVGRISAGAPAVVDLPADLLNLPSRPLAFSGHLIAVAEVEYDDGEVEEARALELHFHPSGSGWEVYDTTARDRDFDGGALSADMRALRHEIVRARDRYAPELTANVMVEFTPIDQVPAHEGAQP